MPLRLSSAAWKYVQSLRRGGRRPPDRSRTGGCGPGPPAPRPGRSSRPRRRRARRRLPERLEPDVAPLLVERHGVAVDEEDAVLQRRRRLHLEREAAHPPETLARRGRVAGEEERARHDDLELAAFGMVEHGRRVAASRGRPLGPPGRLAGPGVHGQDVGVPLLVDHEDHVAGGENRRGAHAVDVVEGTEGMAPEFFAVGGVAEEPEVAEEDPDAVAVGDRGRRGGPVAVVERLGPRPRRLASPEFRAGLAVERDRVERVAFRGREEDPLRAQHRRRVAGRDLRPPEEVAVGSDLDRQGARLDGAAAVRSAEARPVGGLGPGERRESEDGQERERDGRQESGSRRFAPDAGGGAGAPSFCRARSLLSQSRSPPQAEAQVPCASKACTTFLPLRQRWTSSGPSTRRWARMPRYQRASGVSML